LPYKDVPVQATKVYRRSRGTDPPILNFSIDGTGRFTRGKEPQYLLIRRLGGSTAGLGIFENRKISYLF
jgi:hypothetical protein